jgi:sulfofructose kinase
VTAVVCLGLATLDTIYAVPHHPEPDGRVFATDVAVAGGGPAATAAVTLARLGVEVAFVGAVGDDDVGGEIAAGLAREGVDASELAVVPGARSPRSTILAEGARRTIVHFPGTLPPLAPSVRALELCRKAEWVHVDHVGYAAAPDGVRLSVDAGIPIEGLDLRRVALYAPPESVLHEAFGTAEAAIEAGAEVVVVTRGRDGSAAYTRDGAVEAPGVPVDAVSTLGAGDVFHGALLARLLHGGGLADALAFANTCAALSCRALDGRSAIPAPGEIAALTRDAFVTGSGPITASGTASDSVDGNTR